MLCSRSVFAVVLVGLLGSSASAAGLTAHRAIYDLMLDAEKPGTQVDKARGRIAFQLTGTQCEGYTITLRQVTALDTGEGQETVSDLRSESWENAASTSYRFKTQNYVNNRSAKTLPARCSRQKNRRA
jgi:hypothetical protein